MEKKKKGKKKQRKKKRLQFIFFPFYIPFPLYDRLQNASMHMCRYVHMHTKKPSPSYLGAANSIFVDIRVPEILRLNGKVLGAYRSCAMFTFPIFFSQKFCALQTRAETVQQLFTCLHD